MLISDFLSDINTTAIQKNTAAGIFSAAAVIIREEFVHELYCPLQKIQTRQF